MVKYLLFLSSILLLSCSGNHNSDMKKEIKDEILSEISQKNMYVPKGDGSNFYAEPISIGGIEHYIHHSTLNCYAINVGVQRNCYKLNGYSNTFCHHCMDDKLIDKFNRHFFPNGYK